MAETTASPADTNGSAPVRKGYFHQIVTFFSYLYLLRVPLIIGAIMILLPPAAIWSPLKSLLENLFVLTPANMFWVMMVALTLAWSLLVVSRIVILNATARFQLDDSHPKDVITGWYLLGASAPTVSILVCACVEKASAQANVQALVKAAGQGSAAALTSAAAHPVTAWCSWIAAALGGALVAYVADFLGLAVSVAIAPKYDKKAAERFKIPFPWGKKILDSAESFRPIKLPESWNSGEWALKHLPPDLRDGYLDDKGHIYPGQWLVFILLAISIILYFVVGAFRGAHLGMPSSVPALAYVLILMLVLTYLLSMVAFFLDRYKIPLLVPIALLCTLSGQFPQSDHYFAIRDGVTIAPVLPSATLAIRGFRSRDPMRPSGRAIVVATAGGGIQAAGWTVKVMNELQDACPAEPGLNFGDSIAAISAVSGGAVGAMFYVNKYDTVGPAPGFHADAQDSKETLKEAEASTLSDVAWAMVYVDPDRMFFPYGRNSSEEKTVDRGYVLEQAWRNKASIYAYLSNWRDGVTQGYRPAVIFNSTVAETGQPFLLATTDIDIGNETPARDTFVRKYPNADLPVVTAARLAASFPFVSPASRPLTSKPEDHLVDGGYYDNFGVDSLAAWLDQALCALPARNPGSDGGSCWQNQEHPSAQQPTPTPGLARPDVLFIQIRSFPYESLPEPISRGWFYQTYAPLDALVSVRTTAQLVRDREELNLLRAKWRALDKVDIRLATFEFRGKNPPLSWMMTEQQDDEIDNEWQKTLDSTADQNHKALETVRDFCNPKRGAAPAESTEAR